MSKGLPKKFNYSSTREIPSLGKYKVVWDLANLYYKNAKDPQIEKDISTTEKLYKGFRIKWHGTDFTSSEEALVEALAHYEKLLGTPSIARPGRYFSLRQSLNVNDQEADRALAQIEKRLRKAGDQIIFFRLKLGKLSKEDQKRVLSYKNLERFRYYLDSIFAAAKHDLTEPEEKIVRLKARTSSVMWFDAVEKIISNRQVIFKGKDMAIPEALENIDLLPIKDRIKLWDLIMTEMKQIGEVAEHEMNAIISDARGEDEIRGFKKPYSATALSYEHDEKSIESLVQAVSDKGFKLSQKFYKLKAKYHKVNKLHYTDKYRSIGDELSITFEESMRICRDVFYGLKKEYGEIFDEMLRNGKIDVFPKKGKRGGAFMSSDVGQPTHVFLNHVANFKSLETLAHEMGHAIHAYRSSVNSPLYNGFSTVTAETASTLFENLVFDAVYRQVPDKDKMILLHDRITRDISTIERQIAFFNCELEIHHTIHDKGVMSNEELANCMYRHLRSYLGSAVDVTKEDGYSYVYIPHLRYGFYVYSYAFGLLMSTLMSAKYKEDNSYIEEIDKFLSAGSSDTVVNIFKSIDIDTTQEDTFLKALENQARDIATFEKFVLNR